MTLVAEIFGAIAIILAVVSLQYRDKTKLLLFQTIQSVIKTFSMFFAGGIAGAYNQLVGLVRKYWFYKNSKNAKKNELYLLFLFCGLSVLVTILTWEGLISLFPMIAIIGVTYGLWQDDPYILRWFSLFGGLGYGTYNFIISNNANAISEVIMFTATLVSIATLHMQDNKKEKTVLENAVPNENIELPDEATEK